MVQESLDKGAKLLVLATALGEELFSLPRREFHCSLEDRLRFSQSIVCHGKRFLRGERASQRSFSWAIGDFSSATLRSHSSMV
jgi:hypothetical protein